MKKIALIIGLQYFGKYKLNGCYNDTLNIIKTIKDVYNFENNETLYINDKNKGNGTKDQIIQCLKYITSGDYDFIFFYYAGHGSYKYDLNNDESNVINNNINIKL